MDVRNDKGHRRGTLVFDPMRSRAAFGEDLAGVKLLCRSVVMVIGENPAEDVDGVVSSFAEVRCWALARSPLALHHFRFRIGPPGVSATV